MQALIANNPPYIDSSGSPLRFDLPQGSIVWQDSGFTDYEWEDHYLKHEAIEFATQRKKNSKRGDSFIDAVAKKHNRKTIETVFSIITNRFPKRIHRSGAPCGNY